MVEDINFKGWEVFEPEHRDEYIHVVPANDLEEHLYHVACPCNPIRDAECLDLYVHNAFDGRKN